MAGLLDSIFNTPEGRLGIGLLAMAGPQSRPMGVGERIAGALQQQDAYKQQLAEQESNKLRNEFQAEQMAGMRRKNSREDAAMKAAMRKQQALSGLWSGGSPALAPLMGDAESGILPSPGKPATLGQFDVQAALRAGYSPEEIEKLASLRNVGLDEVARTMTGMQNGREVSQQFDKFGRPVGQGMEQFRAPIMQNLGNQTVALNPFSLQKMQSFAMGMTPGQAASNNIALQNLGLSRARFDFEKEKNKAEGGSNGYTFNAAAGGYVPKVPGGKFIPLEGINKTDKPLTESQSKSLLFGSRMDEANRIIEDAASQGFTRPSNFKNAAESVPFIGGTLGALANATPIVSKQEQKLEQAQRDFINAVLRKESGAVITAEEFESAKKQYFPVFGEDPEVSAQKKANRELATRLLLQEGGIAPRSRNSGQSASGKVGGMPADIQNFLKQY